MKQLARAAAAALFIAANLCAHTAPAAQRLSPAAPFTGQRFLMMPLSNQRRRPIAIVSLFDTLFNDFRREPDGTTYVQTGDIPAMWLRDSAEQTIPYVRFAQWFPRLRLRFAGVIERNARYILTDPYANAFMANDHIWERKWEVDSLSFPIMLLGTYWSRTHDKAIFTPALHRAFRAIVVTYRCEQAHDTCSHYRYPYHTGTAYNYAGGTGLIWCAFRPSDDAVRYRFNIPQEMLAVVAMRQLSELSRDGYHDMALSFAAEGIALAVERGIQNYGRYYDFRTGWTYVYETDAEGRFLRMDDANVPDLLATPLFEYRSSTDPVYLNTRAFVLSDENPYYYRGRYAMGLGSPHTPAGWVWPLGIITRALTATSAAETSENLTMLAETGSSDFLFHESFDPNAYWHFTRAQFGWANASYAELIFRSVAGFAALDLNPRQDALPFQSINQTPTLTSPIVQLENQARLIEALGDLLAVRG